MELSIKLNPKNLKMNNKISILLLSFLLVASFFLNSCSVGALVNIKAPDITHPVSHTNNFYTSDGELITQNQYEVIKSFSYNFTKWGVSSIIEIDREADISDDLNDLISDNNGDAIVELTISVGNSPANGITFFTKVISFWGSLIFIPLAIIETSTEYALIGAGSAVIYIFAPAAADINVKGKVVKIIRH